MALAVAGAILGAAPFVLWLFADALDEVLALPAWLRASPTIVRDHGAELSDLVGQARAQRAAGTRRRVHGLRDGWRAGKLLLQAHAEVPGYGAALRLVSVPFLIAVALAVVGVATEVVLAPSVLVVCAALRLA